MLILLIRSYCKICLLPTIVVFTNTRDCNVGEQNQHFAELTQKVCLYISVLLRGLPSLDGILECFVRKKWKRTLPNLCQTDYRQGPEKVF